MANLSDCSVGWKRREALHVLSGKHRLIRLPAVKYMCTPEYHQGYVPRQALYACKTCIEKDSAATKGGICLACSYSCHEGHELYELYTKRNFRCDCGVTTKFPQTPCTIYPVS